jgi:hypothetical protein
MNRYYYSFDSDDTPSMAFVVRKDDAQDFEVNQGRTMPLVACSRLEWEAVIDGGAWLITEVAQLKRGRSQEQIESSIRRSAMCAQNERRARQRAWDEVVTNNPNMR